MLSKHIYSISCPAQFAVIAVSNFPRRVKNTLRPLCQKIKFNFFNFIAWLVIVFMNSIKIKNDGNIFLCKIPMIRSVIKTVRMLTIIVGIIKNKIGVVFVCCFAYTYLSSAGKFVSANDVDIGRTVRMLNIPSSNHINVQINNSIL